MINEFDIGNSAAASVVRSRKVENKSAFKGVFHIQHIRNGKILQEMTVENAVTNVGKDDNLDVAFVAGTQITTWYLGFIDLAGFTALAAADTMAVHGGWTELTAYSEATRPAWTPGAPAAQAIVNGTPVDFNITGGAATIRGVFAVSNNVKSGTTGVLWGTALFASDIPITGGDLVRVTYTVSIA